MPLGWERLNIKKQPPNKNIVFIKPRPGPDEATSRDFLERIAAQCLPIMNKHHLAVTSLEEYEPNREFWGRNFNHGEVIQLILRSPSTGRWLPFKFVQMVMLHELSHNKQMSHSKHFWAVRNELLAEMKILWGSGYTGDGLWGRGVLLENGHFSHEQLEDDDVLPENMCGGGFLTRRSQKRKSKRKLTYQEQKERRIRRKFGENGIALGADDSVKVKLEGVRRPAGKPRVAGSKRGRELRAAAALARFEPVPVGSKLKDEDLVTDSETDDEDEDIKKEQDDAVDIDGSRLFDMEGHAMVKVCEDEETTSQDEWKELLDIKDNRESQAHPEVPPSLSLMEGSVEDPDQILGEPQNHQAAKMPRRTEASLPDIPRDPGFKTPHKRGNDEDNIPPACGVGAATNKAPNVEGACAVCSVINEQGTLTCTVCSHVLQTELVPGAWQCKSVTCRDSLYFNAGDAGLCGVCSAKKSLGSPEVAGPNRLDVTHPSG